MVNKLLKFVGERKYILLVTRISADSERAGHLLAEANLRYAEFLVLDLEVRLAYTRSTSWVRSDMKEAHEYITENWDSLTTGDTINLEEI